MCKMTKSFSYSQGFETVKISDQVLPPGLLYRLPPRISGCWSGVGAVVAGGDRGGVRSRFQPDLYDSISRYPNIVAVKSISPISTAPFPVVWGS